MIRVCFETADVSLLLVVKLIYHFLTIKSPEVKRSYVFNENGFCRMVYIWIFEIRIAKKFKASACGLCQVNGWDKSDSAMKAKILPNIKQ